MADFTWITYIQMLTMSLQFVSFYIVEQLDRKETQLHFQVKFSLPAVLGWTLIHLAIIAAIMWLHFPVVRGSGPFPGAH